LFSVLSDWNPPCLYYPLGPDEDGQKLYWQAPAPGGPGPFGDENFTIGSWGPSEDVTTFWIDGEGNYSRAVIYPGTGRVDAYWGANVWEFIPFWTKS
jgi:hypothetical protein